MAKAKRSAKRATHRKKTRRKNPHQFSLFDSTGNAKAQLRAFDAKLKKARQLAKALHAPKRPARKSAARKTTTHHSGATMAAKKKRKNKRKSPRTVYRAVKKGGHKRRTSAIRHTNVFKKSKRGCVRRVRRVNPGLVLAALGGAALAVGAGVATGVAVRVLAQKAMPGSDTAQKAIAGVAAIGGLVLAMKHPLLGVGIATGAADAAAQNGAVFRLETMLAPSSIKGMSQLRPNLGAIQYQNMRGLPAYARMGAIAYQNMQGTSTLQPNSIGAIQYQNMQGMGALDITTSNPFDR